ncbi:fumarylacetoacetate hydrolase family protein [Oceanicoccus sp. KOV_DT_Chl]|uniref:fumarylacetoacetate hydrolase family protein n=1 Tax=Oceanicoccus sp. KOV_DT_Chl TaxID=1904639 RepID=UPI000C7D5CB1|nr:fumarylacetoacetate hydrolase family protein [Oceanicoccus sp. KOV_DT_Chl]
MADYQHELADNIHCTTTLGKIVCVGRNYADHAKELNNPIPKQPLLFIKPATAAVPMTSPLVIPQGLGECHHEVEMALLIGQRLTAANREQVLAAIAGVGLALDLTLRDIQAELKQKGQPWERAKAFDGSCPLSAFVAVADTDLASLPLKLYRNNQLQQSGNTDQMVFAIADLLVAISASFTLLPGDVVLTGTPAGVGPLLSGDSLRACLGGLLEIETTVA